MSCTSYNCSELEDHEQVDCNAYIEGGVDALAIVACDHTITDWTSASEWNTNIASGKVKIINGVKVEVPDASPVEVENPVGGGTETITSNYDRTATITDANVTPVTVSFWDSVKRYGGIVVLREVNANRITVIDETVTFTAFRNIPASKKAFQMIKATAKWTAYDEPQIYAEPAGIFG